VTRSLKEERQRIALDYLTKRNTTLRFALKVHEQLHGQPLSKGEWKAARDAVANEAHRERIDAAPVSA
jgi:hypothetical protein